MKHRYSLLIVLLALLVGAPQYSVAQDSDTLDVAWLDGDGNVVINALYDAVVGDTNATGERANLDRVYRLEQSGFYYVTETLQNSGWPLRIVGVAGDYTSTDDFHPVIQLVHREDGNRAGNLISGNGDVELKNLYINGQTGAGDLPYEILRFDGEGARITVDNVLFENAMWGIMGIYARNSDVSITNSKFRNLISHNQPWGGRGFSIWTDVDSVIVENNDFVNIGGFAAQIEGGAANFIWFSHNTIVNNGRQVFLHSWHRNSYFSNNLVVNGFWHGEDATNFDAIRLNTPDLQYSGMFNIEPIPSRYGLDLARKVVFANNAHYREQTFEDFYALVRSEDADFTFDEGSPLRGQPVFNQRTSDFFDKFDGMVNSNLIEGQDPGFAAMPDNQQDMQDFITAIRRGSEVVPLWYYNPGRGDDPYEITWPIPEDLSYTNSQLLSAGTGGYPLGNLNHFPDQKANWEAQKDQLMAEVIAIGGGAVVTELVGDAEAEAGTPGGSASVVEMVDKYAVRVLGSGNPTWEFEMDNAGTYDLVVKHRTWYADNNPGRQTDLIVNGGASIAVTVGIEITSDLPWAEPVVEDVELNAGTNTVTLGKSWGYLEYESVTILDQSGNVVKTLRASMITDYDGTDVSCGGALCASKDAYVDVTGGEVSVPVSVPADGNYAIKINYMVIGGGEASADLYVNDAMVETVSFSGNDSTFLDIPIGNLELQAGTATIALKNVTGSLGIDRIDLFSVSIATGRDATEIPEGYALDQNYPNPFNPATNIRFAIPAAQQVRLTVYNVLGQEVATLVDGFMPSGSHQVSFDASRLASGTYLYRIETGAFTHVKKMSLLK